MELVKLTCDGCGADIELPDDARFVTCRYCGARLEVRHTEGAAFTRVRARVKKVEAKTARLEREVRRLELERELDDLEDDWEERRQDLMNRSKDGSVSVPTRSSAIIVGAAAGIGGLAIGATAPNDMGPAMGLGIAAVGAVVAMLQHQKAVRYEQAEADYFERRDELEERIRKQRRKKKRQRS